METKCSITDVMAHDDQEGRKDTEVVLLLGNWRICMILITNIFYEH